MDLSLTGLWGQMGYLAKGVVVILMIMSLISIWVFIDRLMLFLSAKKQSLAFIGKVGPLLKQSKLDDCVRLAETNKNKSDRSHVVL